MNENLIGIKEAARILGLNDQTVYHHIRNGNLFAVGKWGNSYILERSHVEAFRAKREEPR
jgi:excisionase family DNA binding protein